MNNKPARTVWLGGKDLIHLDSGSDNAHSGGENFSSGVLPPTGPKKRRVKNRAAGVGDDYIDIAPTKVPYQHDYTYKTFTPMFIFVITMMIIFYFTVN